MGKVVINPNFAKIMKKTRGSMSLSEAKKKLSTKDVNTIAKKAIKRTLDSTLETKFVDTKANSTYDSAGTVYDLTAFITQGTGDSGNRIGDKIIVRDAMVNFFVTYGSDTYNFVRVIMFQWHPISTSTPASGDILQDISSASTPMSPYIHDKRKQFRVLADQIVRPVFPTSPPMVTPVMQLRCRKPIKVGYTNAGTSGEGHIFLLVISDSGATGHPGVYWYSRLEYTDA